MALWSFYMPYALDSHMFEAIMLQYCPDGFTSEGFGNYFDALRGSDNMRWGNLLAPVLSLWCPKWVFALLSGAAAGIMLYSSERLCRLEASTAPSVGMQMLLLWCIIIFLPWRNNILVPVYTLNYTIPAGIALVALYLSCRSGIYPKAWALLLGITAAAGHEGIGLPCGIGALALLMQRKLAGRGVAMTGIVMALTATASIFLSGLSSRATDELSQAAIVVSPIHWAANNCLSIALIAASIGEMTKSKSITVFFNGLCPVTLFFGATALAGTALSAVVSGTPRTAFWPQLCAVICLGSIFHLSIQRIVKNRLFIFGSATLFIIIAYTVWHGIRETARKYTAAIEMIACNPFRTAYIDTPDSWQKNVFELNLVPRGLFRERYTYRALTERYPGNSPAILPPAFADTPLPSASDSLIAVGDGAFLYRPSDTALAACILKLQTTRGRSAEYLSLPYTRPDSTRATALLPISRPYDDEKPVLPQSSASNDDN